MLLTEKKIRRLIREELFKIVGQYDSRSLNEAPEKESEAGDADIAPTDVTKATAADAKAKFKEMYDNASRLPADQIPALLSVLDRVNKLTQDKDLKSKVKTITTFLDKFVQV